MKGIERGLLMTGPLVVQTYRGNKTNTRRIGDRYREWKKGDWLHVREQWRTGKGLDDASPRRIREMAREAGYDREWGPVQYRADGAELPGSIGCLDDFGGEWGRWRQGMHMLKGFARVWLELTDDVAYEPLRDITAEDARAEGVETGVPVPGYKRGLDDPRLAFAALWNHINARRGPEEDRARFTWARNPEVAVIRHRVLSTTGRPQP